MYPSTRMPATLVSPYVHIPKTIHSFSFDTLFIEEPFVLQNVAGFIFKKFLAFTPSFVVCEEKLAVFIRLVSEHYHPNPFHNFQHAVNVLHMTFKLLHETQLLAKLRPAVAFGCLVSALAHDVGHPGHNNAYEVNTYSQHAQTYNDISVLENHHCALAYELLQVSGLIEDLGSDALREFRKALIACIMGTDMSKHAEFMKEMEAFDVRVPGFTLDEQCFVARALVHCADLSNQLKGFDHCYEWTKRLSQEFYEQTLKEEQQGLPSLSFMKVNDNLTMSLNEIRFIHHISIPMWTMVKHKFEHLGFLLDRCLDNLEHWKHIESQCVHNHNINTLLHM